MHTQLENLQQQVKNLEENADLITQDIVRIMPTMISLLSENEKNLKEFQQMRSKDQELLHQIKTFIRKENDLLTKIVGDYDSLQNLAVQIVDATERELNILIDKEKEIVAKLAEVPERINVRHRYGIDLKSTPIIIIMIFFSVMISLGIGMLHEKDKQLSDRKSYELRYRMMELDLPNITAHIDSVFSVNPDKFQNLVIKREEEQKLKFQIQLKQEEINTLNSLSH
ncbi:hypothetical protein [Sphingobacterium sp. BN32]|uniref:hypothetical protein n=1 Tax=Sphingobacterium sp. BN32 TaxID=3058432 RepID=UPI00265D0017|nr:hypothetical protein [Sphingobacterium sp. BN32]WKK60362.1 hypothetical protein QYC40_08985 [Sphingobacterium sp. BN32]